MPPEKSTAVAKRLRRKAFQLAPILGAMIWINWTVDPVMLFDHHFEDQSRHPYVGIITRDLLAGKPHWAAAPYSERLFDQIMFRNHPSIDVLVLGSSIAKPIHREMFPRQSFFNAAVLGGRLVEMVSLWEMARGAGVHPKRVLLQVDARIIGQQQWPASAEWSPIFEAARRRLYGDDFPPDPSASLTSFVDPRVSGELASGFANAKGPLHPYDTLVSPRYLQLCVLFLARKWSSRGSYPVLFVQEDQHLLYPDGSVQWCSYWSRRTIRDFHMLIKNSQNVIIAAEWMRPNKSQCRLFEALVADIQKSGAQVDFVLLPTNPYFYDQAATEYRAASRTLPSTETEDYLCGLASRRRIRVIGSLDPHKAGVVEENFVDCLHLRREAIAQPFTRQSDVGNVKLDK
jgi:hypothetical protein